MPDDTQPPDFDNPPCLACFAFDADGVWRLPTTNEAYADFGIPMTEAQEGTH